MDTTPQTDSQQPDVPEIDVAELRKAEELDRPADPHAKSPMEDPGTSGGTAGTTDTAKVQD